MFTHLLKDCKSPTDFLQVKECDIVPAINLVELQAIFSTKCVNLIQVSLLCEDSVHVATRIGTDIPTDSYTLGIIQKLPKHLVEYMCDLPNKDRLKPVHPTDFKYLVFDKILHIIQRT